VLFPFQSVLRVHCSESVYQSDCPGNMFTRAVAQERVYGAVATGTWIPSIYTTSKRLYKGGSKTESERGYDAGQWCSQACPSNTGLSANIL
jgi:hypothetical protein